MTRRRTALGSSPGLRALSCLILAGACTSYDTVLGEFDAVSRRGEMDGSRGSVQTPGNSESGSSVYRSLEGMDDANPSAFARERMETLASQAAGDLERSSQVILRLLWVAEVDRSALNQKVALQKMARLMEHLGLRVVLPDIGRPATVEEAERRLVELVARREQPLREPERQQRLEALDWFNRVPLPDPPRRRRLIDELNREYRDAPDEQLRSAAETALKSALEHAVHRMFAISLQRDAPFAEEVRRATMQEIHRLGGPDSVAYLLALTQRPPDPLRPGMPGYDPSPFVLLDMVRLCGQLDPERAVRGFRGGPAPVEFLYELISSPITPRRLRLLALESLALSLRKPVSFETDWADDWFREWNEERIRSGPDR